MSNQIAGRAAPGTSAAQDAEIVPTTVGEFVRRHFPFYARKYVTLISFSTPIFVGLRAKELGLSAWLLGLGVGAWALVSAFACLMIALVLSIGGWWNTRRYRGR